MATILRLRGLDTKASTEDIRSFFGDIQIPDGGVLIVGGALGEAFIAFSSDEDGFSALQLNGLYLKDSAVDLHPSNMLEAEHKFDSFLKGKKASFKHGSIKQASLSSGGETVTVQGKLVDPRTSSQQSPDTDQFSIGTAVQTLNNDPLETDAALLLCTLLQGLPQTQITEAAADSPIVGSSPDLTMEVIPGYIRVFGLPPSTTKQEICYFFKGLDAQEVILNIKLGIRNGSLVKFGTFQDATNALSLNECSLGSACVEVRSATEKMWLGALQEREDVSPEMKLNSLKDTQIHNNKSEWPRKRPRNVHDNSEHKSKKIKSNRLSADAPSDWQHIVMVRNMPVTMTKTEIKELLGCPNVPHTNVLHLLDTYRNRTDKAFVIFNKREDYDYAINLSGCHVGPNIIDVLPITKEEMSDMMKAKDKSTQQNTRMKKTQKLGKQETEIKEQTREPCMTARTCVYVRNMPANVRKSQIRALFSENKLKEDDVTLLRDSDGMCSGEAVVQFQSQTNAALALMHHGMEFLGSKLLLTPISVKQMENILANS